MNEIVKFETDTGQTLQITSDDVRKYICENATEKETVMFMQLCKAQRLNPFMREAYLVKYGNAPASMIVGKEVFTKRADANPNYEGFEAGVVYLDKQGNVQKREGGAVYSDAGEILIGGWCKVYVKDRKPIYDEVSLEEYSTGKSMWKPAKDGGKPATMIRKVALVHCLREAFSNDFAGMYTQEEIKQVSTDELPDAPIVVESVETVESGDITSEQESDIMLKVATLAQLRGAPEAQVMQSLLESKTLANADYVVGTVLTEKQAALAIAVLDQWLNKANQEPALAEEDIEF